MNLAVTGLFALLLLAGVPRGESGAEQPHEPGTYSALRARAVAAGADEHLLHAADALAAQGLSREAAALLEELFPAVGGGEDARAVPGTGVQVGWRFSSGIDLYRIEDVDTGALSPDELRDYQLLTESPLSRWIRGSARIQPQRELMLKSIEPLVSLSERKGVIGIGAQMRGAAGHLLIEPSGVVEKWVRASASPSSAFKPGVPHPSDMVGGTLRLTPGSRLGSEHSLQWSAPVSLGVQRYRANRRWYESHTEYRLAPRVAYRGREAPLSLRTGGDLRIRTYDNSPDVDTLNNVRLGTSVEAGVRPPWGSATLDGSLLIDRYTSGGSLQGHDEGVAALRVRIVGAGAPLSAAFAARWQYNCELRLSNADRSVSEIAGSRLELEPKLRVAPGQHVWFEPWVKLERRWAQEADSYLLWDPRRGVEPGVQGGVRYTGVDASVRLSYYNEKLYGQAASHRGDSRSLRSGGDLILHLFERVTLTVFADYQYRLYAPFKAVSRRSENLSVSASMSVTL